MNTSLSRVEHLHNVVLIPISLLLLGLQASAWWSPQADCALFAFLMLLTGLPHGALDHLLHIRHKQNTTPGPKAMLRFLGYYLMLMVCYTAVWMLFPALSLLFFILMSCYHFGQSQWYYFFTEGSQWGRLLYLNWGMAVLSLILCWNIEATSTIIESVVPHVTGSDAWSFFVQMAHYLPWLLLLPPFAFLLFRLKERHLGVVVSELLTLAVIALASHYGGLLMAFILYFGCWHSTKSLASIMRSFQTIIPGYNFWRAYREALPFTIISVAGIGLLLAAAVYQWVQVNPLMLFFIALSVLTLPHMLVLELVYEQKK